MRFAQLHAKHNAYQKVMQVAYAMEMEKTESPRRVRRRLRLEKLLSEYGGAAQVARESGTPKSHFSAMISGTRGLGDGLAAKLEGLYGKPEGWFDASDNLTPTSPPTSPQNQPQAPVNIAQAATENV